eukprot:1633274-Rhodomonas_salina.1
MLTHYQPDIGTCLRFRSTPTLPQLEEGATIGTYLCKLVDTKELQLSQLSRASDPTYDLYLEREK